MHDPLDDVFDQASREVHQVLFHQFLEQHFHHLAALSLKPAKIILEKPGFKQGNSLLEFYQNAVKLPVDLFTNEELDQIVPFLNEIEPLLHLPS